MIELPEVLADRMTAFHLLSQQKDRLARKFERTADEYRSLVYRRLLAQTERRLILVVSACEDFRD